MFQEMPTIFVDSPTTERAQKMFWSWTENDQMIEYLSRDYEPDSRLAMMKSALRWGQLQNIAMTYEINNTRATCECGCDTFYPDRKRNLITCTDCGLVYGVSNPVEYRVVEDE